MLVLFAPLLASADLLLGLAMHGESGLDSAASAALNRRLQSVDFAQSAQSSTSSQSGLALISLVIGTVVAWLIGVCVWLLVATMYKRGIVDKRSPFPAVIPASASMNGTKTFKYGLCSWYEDATYCLYGCFFAGCRLADNFNIAGSGGYWSIMAVLLAASVCEAALGSALTALFTKPDEGNLNGVARLIVSGILAGYLAGKRSAVRAKLGGDTTGNWSMDCLCFWWCLPCSVIQDSRQLDEAAGVQTECCCSLVSKSTAADATNTVMGAPTAVIGK